MDEWICSTTPCSPFVKLSVFLLPFLRRNALKSVFADHMVFGIYDHIFHSDKRTYRHPNAVSNAYWGRRCVCTSTDSERIDTLIEKPRILSVNVFLLVEYAFNNSRLIVVWTVSKCFFSILASKNLRGHIVHACFLSASVRLCNPFIF